MAFLLPLFGFLCGLGFASTKLATYLKPLFASLLAKCFIPIVIIYNMVFYQAGSLSLMIFSFVVALIMFYLFYFIFKDKLRALCVSYINLAWLGFPFALALFGSEVSAPMVALYVGGSIFGNIWAVLALNANSLSYTKLFHKVLCSPPVFALIIAIICRLLGIQHLSSHQWLDFIYLCAKVGMSFTGMCVLGMWLRYTKIKFLDLKRSTQIFAIKLTVGLVLCSFTYYLIPIPHIEQYIGVMFLLFCLPPAANIVALETHYLGTGTSAKYIASGTIVSAVLVGIYAVILHLLKL